MEIKSDVNGYMAIVKDKRQQLESRVVALHNIRLDFVASLQTLVPDIVFSLNLSLKVISAFNGRLFTPLPIPISNPNPKRPKLPPPENHSNATENRSLRLGGAESCHFQESAAEIVSRNLHLSVGQRKSSRLMRVGALCR